MHLNLILETLFVDLGSLFDFVYLKNRAAFQLLTDNTFSCKSIAAINPVLTFNNFVGNYRSVIA